MNLLDEALGECPAIAIIRASGARHVPAVLAALAEGGVRAVELTLNTPGALDAIRAARRDGFAIGAGTVLDPAAARAAVEAGAGYLITPAVLPDVIAAARDLGVPVIPGALTPTEVLTAWRAGATAVKIFPADAAGGPRYIRSLRGPLPDIPLVPTGGVAIAQAAEYMAAGAKAVALGGPLIGDAAETGDASAVRERAAELVRSLAGA